MAKCFITGIDVPLADAQVLDLGAAHHALRDLRQRVCVLERLIEQLGERDPVEFFDPKKHEKRTRFDRRLVSATVAKALAVAHPEHTLFLPWPEYRKRGAHRVRKLRAHAEVAPLPTEQEVETPKRGTEIEGVELQSRPAR